MASRLTRLKEKHAALQEQIRREETRQRASERKRDTRRKVLVGAAVLEWAEKDSSFKARLMGELRTFLVRDIDRELFELPPLEKNPGGESVEAERKSA